MAFKVIAGKFHIVGYSPDGDSVRFAADDVSELLALSGPKPPKLKQGDKVQLRLEGIDALETHYTQGLPELSHQPSGAAESARSHLLDALGFRNVVWNDTKTRVVSADNDGTDGYIVSRTFEQNRRPVSFAYTGDPVAAGLGKQVFVDGPLVAKSVNYDMLASGHAYPTYYDGVFKAIRDQLDQGVDIGRNAVGATVWPIDATKTGVTIPPFANASDRHALLPKLFRRLATYFKEADDLSGFIAYLEASPDLCLFIPNAEESSLHNFVEVHGDRVKMTCDPEDLMFHEK
ncbi:MAG: hypothetical protein U0234_29520 [Sandaracinus sp.]